MYCMARWWVASVTSPQSCYIQYCSKQVLNSIHLAKVKQVQSDDVGGFVSPWQTTLEPGWALPHSRLKHLSTFLCGCSPWVLIFELQALMGACSEQYIRARDSMAHRHSHNSPAQLLLGQFVISHHPTNQYHCMQRNNGHSHALITRSWTPKVYCSCSLM